MGPELLLGSAAGPITASVPALESGLDVGLEVGSGNTLSFNSNHLPLCHIHDNFRVVEPG